MILVVDDTEAVCTMTAAALRQRGYSVVEAHDGQEALSLAAGRSEPIELLITDVVMPRMSGPVLARNLKSCHPETKILFMSGFAQDSLALGGAFLPKPFTAPRLLRKVEELLSSGGDFAPDQRSAVGGCT